MNPTIFFAAIPVALCIIAIGVSRCINKGDTTPRTSTNCLVVLSGMLAALAILVPLGATLIPDSKRFGWRGWMMVGALFSGAVCLFGTVYCMIRLDKDTFVPNTKPHVLDWINATWIALSLLAVAVVLTKLPQSAGPLGTDSPGATRVRFAVARDLPALGSSREMIEAAWGAPTLAKGQELRYQMKDGAIVFCLDPKGVTQSITEIQEVDVNAIGKVCGQN